LYQMNPTNKVDNEATKTAKKLKGIIKKFIG